MGRLSVSYFIPSASIIIHINISIAKCQYHRESLFICRTNLRCNQPVLIKVYVCCYNYISDWCIRGQWLKLAFETFARIFGIEHYVCAFLTCHALLNWSQNSSDFLVSLYISCLVFPSLECGRDRLSDGF